MLGWPGYRVYDYQIDEARRRGPPVVAAAVLAQALLTESSDCAAPLEDPSFTSMPPRYSRVLPCT
ncbi:MAG TPA: hypothetical protein VKJ01_28260 [Candidatus Solibacter sp.]|nr:hypothetical protein [Candidatus Solibacter sp.]